MIKVGYMDYINIFPIFYHLEKEGYDFFKGVPSALNHALATKQIDISPVSSYEYLSNPDNYKILSGAGIIANKSVDSVLLYSKLPVKELNGKKICFTSESYTSVKLAKIILEQFYNLTPEYVLPHEEHDAAVYIGDKALKIYLDRVNLPYKVYDLCTLWYEKTGLPFVFSVWLTHKSNEKIGELHKKLLGIINNMPVDKRVYAEEYLKRKPDFFNKEQLLNYWGKIYYKIDEKEKDGLLLFFKYCGFEGIPQFI